MTRLAALGLVLLVSVPCLAGEQLVATKPRGDSVDVDVAVYLPLLTSNGQVLGEGAIDVALERFEEKNGLVHLYVIVYGGRDLDARQLWTKGVSTFLADADGDGFDDLVVELDGTDYEGIVFVGGWGASSYQYDFPGDY